MDTCCLNRPFDNQAQDRVRIEAEAVLAVLARCQVGEWELAASDMLDMELAKSPNMGKLAKVQFLYSLARNRLTVTNEVKGCARMLQANGMKVFDSLHLALAEIYRQDVLLTTDDTFLAAAHRIGTDTVVANPVSWFMEVTQHDH